MTSKFIQTNNPVELNNKSETSTIWGGRFDGKPDEVMGRINPSIDFDKRFYKQDIQGSRIHAKMLAEQNIISKKDTNDILFGLDQVEQEIDQGTFVFSVSFDTLHGGIPILY